MAYDYASATYPDHRQRQLVPATPFPGGGAVRSTTSAARLAAVEHVILTMRERLNERLTLQEMADVAILSPYYFDRVFTQVTGVTPCKYLAALRLEAAKRLLLTTTLSVTDVCLEVGYNSLGTFTTLFCQAVGLPPSRLRRVLADDAPVLDFLRRGTGHLTAPPDAGVRRAAAPGGVRGRVTISGDTTGLIFVGLFTSPIALAQPVGCAILSGPGPYRFQPDAQARGRTYLMAVAYPEWSAPFEYLLPDPAELWVGVSQGPMLLRGTHVDWRADLALRRVQLTDPPLVAALPILAGRSLRHPTCS
jgi:AraC-like DNA-binding protein